jgi:FkbM family methyltransferase
MKPFAWLKKLYSGIHPSFRRLVFDVGANTGDKTQEFLKHGAKVVCFEPQPACIEALQQRFRGNNHVVVVPTAIGADAGVAELSICTEAPTISTLSTMWKEGRFKDHTWDRTETVPVTTLDAAIEQYGMPFYCKIDVEGFEKSVLMGLTRPIPVLSFEFCAEGLAQTRACLGLLDSLGYSAFNICLGEAKTYLIRGAVSATELWNRLKGLRDPLAWGDIYATMGSRIPDSELLPKLPPRRYTFPNLNT